MRFHRLAVPAFALAALMAAGAPAATVGAAPASGAPLPTPHPVVPFIADDWTRAMALARQSKLPVFVEAWAPW